MASGSLPFEFSIGWTRGYTPLMSALGCTVGCRLRQVGLHRLGGSLWLASLGVVSRWVWLSGQAEFFGSTRLAQLGRPICSLVWRRQPR